MSRIGKKPINIPSGVTVDVSAHGTVTVKGPKGTLTQDVNPDIQVSVEGQEIILVRPTESKRHKSLHGLYRSLINNMVIGVSEGYKKDLELVGVGYKASIKGNAVALALGFSHPVEHALPAGVTAECPSATEIILRGVDKQLVGQVAADIRSYRAPEPYKGKGVRYANEQVRTKEAKKK